MGTKDIFVFLDFTFNGAKAGRVVIQLFSSIVPKTAENFRCLCTGEKGIGRQGKPLHFKGSRIHKVISQCMVLGGDIIHGNGTGGESIYGQYFENEKFFMEHLEGGMVGLVNDGFNKNSSQFYITTVPCTHLDDQNIIVGKVIKGLDIVKEMADIPRVDDIPQQEIIVSDCGEFKPNDPWNIEENDGTADVYPPWPSDWNGSLDIKVVTNAVKDIKESGNTYFYKHNFLDSERKYKKAIRYIDWYLEKTKRKRGTTLAQLRTNALLNLSAVRLKINKNKDVLEHCNEILKTAPQNGKAYYRRACAKIGMKEYDDALKDLQIAYKFHPNDAHIKSTFEATKKKRQAYLKKEKIFYLKVFRN